MKPNFEGVIGYAPPLNRFERWRDRTWPKWATAVWPIRRGRPIPIVCDRYASDSKVYFLASDQMHVFDSKDFKRMN